MKNLAETLAPSRLFLHMPLGVKHRKPDRAALVPLAGGATPKTLQAFALALGTGRGNGNERSTRADPIYTHKPIGPASGQALLTHSAKCSTSAVRQRPKRRTPDSPESLSQSVAKRCFLARFLCAL